MTCTVSSIFFTADVTTLSPGFAPCLAGRGHVVVTAESLHALVGHLQIAQAAPELVVLSAATLSDSRLNTVQALRAALKKGGTTALLLSDLAEPLTTLPLTTFVAYAVGAHASVAHTASAEGLANLAELLLRERVSRAAAAGLRKGAAPQPPLRSDYPQARASGF